MRSIDEFRRQGQYILETLVVLWYLYIPTRTVLTHPDVTRAPDDLAVQCTHRADQLGLDTIDVYCWEHPFINAVPVGTPERGTLLLSTRLLEFLEGDRLDAAITHELAHIRHQHDRRFAGILGAITALLGAGWLAVRPSRRGSVLWVSSAGAFAVLVLLAVVRRYERQADRSAIEAIGSARPLALAILSVQTGNPTAEIHEYRPRRRGSRWQWFDLYPRVEDRFPDLFDS